MVTNLHVIHPVRTFTPLDLEVNRRLDFALEVLGGFVAGTKYFVIIIGPKLRLRERTSNNSNLLAGCKITHVVICPN
jgi:hypothetical protein